MQAPHTWDSVSWSMWTICLRLQRVGLIKFESLIPCPAALSHLCLKLRILLKRSEAAAVSIEDFWKDMEGWEVYTVSCGQHQGFLCMSPSCPEPKALYHTTPACILALALPSPRQSNALWTFWTAVSKRRGVSSSYFAPDDLATNSGLIRCALKPSISTVQPSS